MTNNASAVDIMDAVGARAPPNFDGPPTEFGGSERETNDQPLRAPLDLKTYLRLCNTTMISILKRIIKSFVPFK